MPDPTLARWRENARHAEQLRNAIEVVLLDHAHQLDGDQVDTNLAELAHVHEQITGWNALREIAEDRTRLKEPAVPSDKTGLGDRMKAHEAVTRAVLPRRTYALIRVDGRSFHSFLRHADRPYDYAVMAAMDGVGKALCEEISGAVFAYTQSDECSVLVTDFASHGTQPWFGGVVQKIVSVSASIATVAFNNAYESSHHGFAQFDARVFTIPDPAEVANYFLWRQRDAVRNSITMAAQAKFSHRDLHGVNTSQMQELLWSKHGINWDAYPDGCKRGRITTRRTGERETTYTDRRTDTEVTTMAVRSWWETTPAPHFTSEPDGWLAAHIPAHGGTLVR